MVIMRVNKSPYKWLVFILTLSFFDRFVELMLKWYLHHKRDKYVEKTLLRCSIYLSNQEDSKNMRATVERETRRIYSIVDRSILRDRVIRGKYTFFGTAIIAALVFTCLNQFAAITPFASVLPLTMALVAWVISIVTIPISYNQRVKGAMDSVVGEYEYAARMSSQPTLTAQSTNAMIKVLGVSPKVDDVESAMEQVSAAASVDVVIDNAGDIQGTYQERPSLSVNFKIN